jgi:hypothetical protein
MPRQQNSSRLASLLQPVKAKQAIGCDEVERERRRHAEAEEGHDRFRCEIEKERAAEAGENDCRAQKINQKGASK